MAKLDPASESPRGGATSAFSALLRELAPDASLGGEPGWTDAPLPPPALERFEPVRELGRGGFGVVWEARDRKLGRAVALKLVRPGRPVAEEQLLHEAEAVASLSHPNIVTLHDVGRCEAGPYLVLELLRGESLAQRLERGRPPQPEALRIALEVARGLAHAHAHGIVHRDLKPANVFLCADGRVKLLDLGMASAFGHRTPEGGTCAYMAPEQRSGAPEDERTDVFALGVLIFQLLSGRLPFGSGGEAGAPRLEVPAAPALGALVQRMLARDPLLRPRTASDALPALEEASAALAGATRVPPVAVRRRWIPARRPARIAGAVVIAALALGAGLLAADRARPPAGPPSVAVLPFADLSQEGNQAWLADGMAEEILHALAELDGVRVTGRASSFRFRGGKVDLRDIGAQLGVANVLDGSVRRAGDRLRVTAELVDVARGTVRWSETFDRTVDDLFGVEEEIARAVAAGLQVALLARERPPGGAPRAEAHVELLRGRHLARRGNEADHRAALQALERAVALDPAYALAAAELSQARLALLAYLSSDAPGWEATLDGTRGASRAAAERAIALAPGLAAGWLARSQVKVAVDGDWAGAWADLERAARLGPRDLDVRFQHARAVAQGGRLAEAIVEMEGVFRDDPLSANAAVSLGAMYAAVGRYADSRATLERALAIEPKHAKAVRNLCATEILDGRPARALELAGGIGPGWARRHVEALALHALGRHREAGEALAWLSGTRWNQAQVAGLHAWFGDRDAAFAWLERAAAAHDMGVFHVKVDPFLRSLHGDPRLAAFLRKVGLPEG